MASQRLWTAPFIAIGIVNLFTSLTFLILMTFVATYAVSRFGQGEAAAGFAASVFIVGALGARFVAGTAIDRFGRTRLLVASLVLMAVCAVALPLVDAFGAFLVLRALQGVGFGVANTAANTIAQDLIPPARRGEGTGWFSLSASFSQAVGPFLGISLHQFAGFDAVFWSAVGLSTIGALIAAVAPLPSSGRTGAPRRGRPAPRLAAVLERRALPMAVLALVLGGAYSGVVTFLGAYAAERGIAAWAGAFFIVYAAVLVVSRPVSGSLIDRVGDNAVVLPGIAATCASFVLLAWLPEPWTLFAAAVLLALGYGSLVSVCQAIAVRQSPDHRRGVAVSTYYIGLDTGFGFMPLALGATIGAIGFEGAYLATAIGVAVVATPWYWITHGRRGDAQREGDRDGPPPTRD